MASWVFVFGVNLYFVNRGLSKGIEKFCSWAMPAMAVCALVVLVRVLTLGTPDPGAPDQNVLTGLGYMWNPNFSKLADFSTWLAAAGQVFFTLSVGFGIIINYASYMRPQDDVALSGLTAASTNELFEVGFGGMITLTAAFVFLGLSGTTAAVANGSFSLGFATLPIVFAHMGPLGNLIGAIWFLMLFLAAITSSLSMYQPAVALPEGGARHAARARHRRCRGPGHDRLPAHALVQEDGALWSTLDFWVGTFLIFVMAGVQIIASGGSSGWSGA